MKVSKIPGLGRFGIIIDDVNLENISDEEWMEIGRLHLQSLVTVIRNTNVTKDRYGELVAKFGQTRGGNYVSKKYKKRYNKDWKWVLEQINKDSSLIDEDDKIRIKTGIAALEISNHGHSMLRVAGGYNDQGIPNGFFADGELKWHSNESGNLCFVPGVALLGQTNMIGTSTGFITTTDYYESVGESFRSELDEMIICHRYQPGRIAPGLNATQETLMANFCVVQDTEIPLVITSPGGIKGLHYSPNTTWSIKGMTKAESDRVFAEIEKELFVDKYIYDHWYKHNTDLLLFDNSIVQHRRSGYIDGRLALRISFDYTNLQTDPWLPYADHPTYQKRYNKEIHEIVTDMNISQFKLPPFGLIDRVKSWAGML